MEKIVAAVRGTDKFSSFQELLKVSQFDDVLLAAFKNSGKEKGDFKIIIKPNMMVFVNPKDHTAIVTDKDLVESLVDHLINLGFNNIMVCEAQNDVGRMLKNHNVEFVAGQIGFEPKGRYKIVDLTLESVPYKYIYKDKKGNTRKWKHSVGRSWMEADFRITFPKCKTHEHDWMTLGVKNVYGCLPKPNKVAVYHIRYEVFDVTARSLLSFPVHFSFIDAWVGSDGFQGYKIANPQKLNMLFGGGDIVAVDMEIFKRAGLDPHKSIFLKKTVEQLYDGAYPTYTVKGDKDTKFSQLCDWKNIEDKIVQGIDVMEEVYIAWGFINLKAISTLVDYKMFPPKNFFYRLLVWLSKKLYGFFKLFKWYRKLYKR
ncbi:MAG: DUF362 domain-containing protein [Candidatus Aminicenantes bacterium]|nr:DUF362 domain-containing protein [Candidatus Aminicenantes bacterium]NIM84642.1 DUF362 domain-containing protein [Candidatus Aminicenantes bacterium]NIN24147.1 DUF362 domain-containing protein [Candidatus Aminicenantes bacterium]NIN47871.1 DUF362 domain-containing protein [Candidatus Aminicenantes bacterium]NIN90809.1 DUF362 domain-containing protein [Candidatus Aminicenantes bacterium]